MKLRSYRISFELMAHALRGGTEHRIRIVEGLPVDAVVRAVYMRPYGILDVVVESSEFEQVMEGKDPPVHDIVAERIE